MRVLGNSYTLSKVYEQKQETLHNVVRHLFPNEKASIINPTTNNYLELDVWLPKLKLAFEFQDSYHYSSTYYSHRLLDDVQAQDRRGETLITVPFWWDGKRDSLIATIKSRRPELLPECPISCPPISHILPDDYSKSIQRIPDIGELMLASFPPTSFFKSSPIDYDNPWWLGEKYDGIRCCWHTNLSKLFTRSGLEIVLPEILAKSLSLLNIHLDAEIWFGKNSFYEAQEFIQSSAYPHNLEYLRLITFDHPDSGGSKRQFEKRYRAVIKTVPSHHPFVTVAGRMKVTSRVQLTRMIRNVLDDTGEGVILRLPRSLYLPGRSTSLLKLKAARSDMEALVIQVLSDSCVLRLPSGFIFSARINLNSSAEDLQENTKGGERIEIKEGDIVTVAFNGKRGGMEIVRVRRDVTWASVLNSTRPSPNLLKQYSEKVVDYSPRTYGYWVHARRKQMRKFLEKIMFNLKLDPLIPSCWYTVSPDQFKLFKGGKTLLGKFDGSLAKAAMYLFPDIGLKLHKFSYAARGFWAIPTNRKQFFDTFAQVHKFDFLRPSNWYKVSEHSIFSTKNASSVLRYYEGDYVSALTEIYPNIGLERAKFRTT